MKEDAIDDLLIRYILDEATSEERREVEAWLGGGSDNVKRFEQTRFLLDNSRKLAQSSPLSEQEAWERFKEKRADGAPKQLRIRPVYLTWLKIAAVLVLVVNALAIWYYGQKKSTRSATWNAYEAVVTGTLPDGSVFQLNKHSTLTYSDRVVQLDGEAFFKVVHNAAKPFKVHTQDVDITDIGTAFNVKSVAGGKVEVIVESGVVKVSRKTSSVILKQRQMMLVQPGSALAQPEGSNDLLYQYYRTDEFVTDHTPLSRLVNVLNEAYRAHIEIEGSGLADLPITGTYKKESLDKILQVVLLTTPEIHRINRGDKIILTR